MSEASLRSAISRAYYGVFGQARNYLRDREGRSLPRGAEAHRFVRDQFRSSHEQTRKEIGEALDRLRIARNKADYDDLVPGLPALTIAALVWAQETAAKLVLDSATVSDEAVLSDSDHGLV